MIQDLLANTISNSPGNRFICSGRDSFTYSEVGAMASSVAAHLAAEGLRRKDTVVVLWDNGPEYAALLFGILMAGGVAVPLNPTNTEDGVRYAVEHCGAKYLAVTGRSLPQVASWWKGAPIISDVGGTDVPVTAVETVFGSKAAAPRAGGGSPEDLAMVLYTSGTTGRPKGVMLSHRNLEANTRSILAYLSLASSDRTLAILPFYYSYGNSLLLTHAKTGATLVVENGFAFVNKCLDTMRKNRVTGFSGVPSHFSLLLNRSRFLELDWPDLRYMTCAGGGLPVPVIRRIRESLAHVRLHVMYGQTEGAARLSSLDPALVDRKIGSMGKGIPGVELRVVDKSGTGVAPGDVGEIVARGDNIMMGYLGDPEATLQALRDGWLHTGDLATVDDEGFIYVKGREKEFIKTGGYRISPQQIEEALLQDANVGECCVVGVPDDLLGESIVAFVVFRNDHRGDPPISSLVALARRKLPHYMVPQSFQAIPALPKTDSGKIRRIELRERAIGQAANVRAPGTAKDR